MWCVHDMPSQAALVRPSSSTSITSPGESTKPQPRRRLTLRRRRVTSTNDTTASSPRANRRSAVTSMKSFVRSRRGHGDDEVDVSDTDIFDARGLFEASFDDGDKCDPTSTFSSMSAPDTSSHGHTDAYEDERIEVSLQPHVSEEPQNYEEILRSESRASGADTPSQGGSCHSFHTALSASSRTPSIESGTTAESSLYLQCDGLRLRPITPELLPNEGPDHIRMASSDSEHEEELLSSPYVDSEPYEMRPFSLQKPVLRSLSLSRLNHLTPTVKPKLSVITQLSDPIEPLSPEPTVTIFKKEKPEKAPTQPPPPPPLPEPAPEPEVETDTATLKSQTTGTTSSTARTSDTLRLATTATGASQFTMFSSLNDSSFRLSPISATIEQAFKQDIRFGSAPVSSRPLVADYENRKSLVAIPCTPVEYIDNGSHSPPALSPDVTGEHNTFPPISTPPGTADGTSPLPVVTKLQHPLPPPLPSKEKFAPPAVPESPAVIALEATPAPSAYRPPRDTSAPPPVPPKGGSSGINGGSTTSLLSKSSRESLRSAPPKPAPTISLPPIPVKALSVPIPAKTSATASTPSDTAPAVPAKSNGESSPKSAATSDTNPRSAPSRSAHKESPATAPAAPKAAEHEAAPVKHAPKPLPQPQPRVANTLPSPPRPKVESQPEPMTGSQAEANVPSPPVRKPRSLPPIPVKLEAKETTSVPPTLPTPPTRKVTVRRPLPPVPKKKEDVPEQLLSPVPKLPTSPLPADLPVNATNALKKITINTAVVTPIRMSLASTPVDFSADYSPSSPTTPTAATSSAQDLPFPLFTAFDPSVPSQAWTEYPAAPVAGVEADDNRVSFYHAI